MLAKSLRAAGYELRRIDAPPRFLFSPKQFEVAAALVGNGLIALLPESKAKDGQDLVAAHLVDGAGFFVDVGAYDGVHKSNTWMLEMVLGWNGILVEPHPVFFNRLADARSGQLDARAISDVSGQTVRFILDDQRSRIVEGVPAGRDGSVEVETVSIAQLLSDHAAPEHIDYLSIDVEGREIEVLAGFPFEERTIGLVTAEHNFDATARGAVRDLLEGHGYIHVLPHLSRNEDWFVNPALVKRLAG